jgi:KDO2-lipid IV(A) lauroyltransferase
LLTGHVTCLELSARLIAEQVPGAVGIYRPLRNRLLNDFQTRRRVAYGGRMIARDKLRAIVRELRAGKMIWYAPDQDFGPSRSRFVPFFGIPTATATGMLELARLGRARVVPAYPLKDPRSGRITVRLESAFEEFPGPDAAADLTRFNAFLERRIHQHPAQYWWLHRRFKSAPSGHRPRYR